MTEPVNDERLDIGLFPHATCGVCGEPFVLLADQPIPIISGPGWELRMTFRAGCECKPLAPEVEAVELSPFIKADFLPRLS